MSSNDTIAGSDATDGNAGLALKSVRTLAVCVAMAYSASFSEKSPASSVSAADGAIERLCAPRTATSSYKLLSACASPSTSKKVVYSRWKGGMTSVEPVRTKRKSNSAARIVVDVPSAHCALMASIVPPE